MSKNHIPCEFCSRGPLENCEEVLHCPASWDDDPEDCADCKVETDTLYADGKPRIVLDPEKGARPYDPRFDNCQILTDTRIVSVEMGKTYIPCDFCKKGPLENCKEVVCCRAKWGDDPVENDPVEEVRKEMAEYLASDKFRINLDEEN